LAFVSRPVPTRAESAWVPGLTARASPSAAAGTTAPSTVTVGSHPGGTPVMRI